MLTAIACIWNFLHFCYAITFYYVYYTMREFFELWIYFILRKTVSAESYQHFTVNKKKLAPQPPTNEISARHLTGVWPESDSVMSLELETGVKKKTKRDETRLTSFSLLKM